MYNIIPGITGFFLAAFVLIIVLIRPIWVDLDKFISQATGFTFSWVMLIVTLTAILSFGFVSTFLRNILKPSAKSFPVFSVVILIIWAAVHKPNGQHKC